MATIDDKSKQLKNREKIAKEIAKTSDTIRQKYLALKTGKMEEDNALERHFKPIVEPLKQIADATKSDGYAGANKSDDQSTNYEFENDVMQPATKKRKICDRKMQCESSVLKRKSSSISINRSLVTSTPIKKQLKAATNTPLLANTQTDNFQLMQQQSREHDLREPRPPPPPFVASTAIIDEDVYETTGDSLATIRRELQTSKGMKSLRTHFGPLGEKYMGFVLGGDGDKSIDKVYGVYFDSTGKKLGTKLGNKSFDVDIDDNLIIDGVRYVGTPGLYELIFKKFPDDDVYTDDDKQKYKSILLVT